jgi:hypothetical protein
LVTRRLKLTQVVIEDDEVPLLQFDVLLSQRGLGECLSPMIHPPRNENGDDGPDGDQVAVGSLGLGRLAVL